MTDPQNHEDEPLLDEPDDGAPSSPDPMAALLKRSLAGPPSTARSPSVLRGVQRRIRQRSRGKFFADGWSTTDARVSHTLIALAMLFILVVAYFALGPVGIQ
jgi:hypothetical protein